MLKCACRRERKRVHTAHSGSEDKAALRSCASAVAIIIAMKIDITNAFILFFLLIIVFADYCGPLTIHIMRAFICSLQLFYVWPIQETKLRIATNISAFACQLREAKGMGILPILDPTAREVRCSAQAIPAKI